MHDPQAAWPPLDGQLVHNASTRRLPGNVGCRVIEPERSNADNGSLNRTESLRDSLGAVYNGTSINPRRIVQCCLRTERTSQDRGTADARFRPLLSRLWVPIPFVNADALLSSRFTLSHLQQWLPSTLVEARQ